jgi:aminoglycoside 6'-N-acetyltransferase I
MQSIVIRRAEFPDLAGLAKMFHCLWPESSADAYIDELVPLIEHKLSGQLPAIIFVAEQPPHGIVGFIEVGLRSHADGCDPTRPVGFIEGWYVASEFRRRKVGTQLVIAAEQWARDQGCMEMSSDTWLDALISQRAHEALGFEIVDRCVHYRKLL